MSTVAIDALSNPGTSFTPSLTFGGGSTGMTYGTRTGVYVRVGSLVFFSLNIVLTAKGSSTGVAVISGLPVAASSAAYTAPATYVDGMSSISGAIVALIAPSASACAIYQTATGSTAQLTNSNFTNATNVFLSGVYAVA
jgi:hypothetical protein